MREIVEYIRRQGTFDYSVTELERLGLECVCEEYEIYPDDWSESEKDALWQELLEMAEEVEFKHHWEKHYRQD